jgi:ABC-type Mn2+/Zn2+ transport system permease subunit
MFWLDAITPSLFVAIPVGWIGSVLGMYLSLKADPNLGGWPTGASMVITFGGIVFASYLLRLFIPERRIHKISVPIGEAAKDEP